MSIVPVLDGLVLHGVEDSGVQWVVPKNGVVGWWDSVDPRLSTSPRARAHGVWAGESWLSARDVVVEGVVRGPSHATVVDALDRLNAAAALSDVVLSVDDEGMLRRCSVRRSHKPEVSWLNAKAASWSIQLLAADPRLMGESLTGSTALPSTSGGIQVPLTVPVVMAENVVTGQVSLVNPGNIEGPVFLRIDGPIQAPVVTHVSSGRRLVFASSLVLGTGEFLTVDMEGQRVLAQGVEPRDGWIVRDEWSQFQPGPNLWAFSATGDGPGTLTVEAVPTWQ